MKQAGILPVGKGGWGWDTNMGAEGNLRGWGSMLGGVGLTLATGGKGKLLATALKGLAGYKGLGLLGELTGKGIDQSTGHKATRREIDRRMTLMPTPGEIALSGFGASGLRNWVNQPSVMSAALAPWAYGGHNQEPLFRMFGLEESKLPGYNKHMNKESSQIKLGSYMRTDIPGLMAMQRTHIPGLMKMAFYPPNYQQQVIEADKRNRELAKRTPEQRAQAQRQMDQARDQTLKMRDDPTMTYDPARQQMVPLSSPPLQAKATNAPKPNNSSLFGDYLGTNQVDPYLGLFKSPRTYDSSMSLHPDTGAADRQKAKEYSLLDPLNQ